ncbi:RHS repeat-associated core domain-containing protein [Paracidovorax citrulli]|uniref:YD repeat protein n=3 Tax=Pseudomonadota TaxID=1224 RepID=A1TTL0_PARC0|nr:RHS repeat-associated core domain-containing protein [Paracidovorax citrulli]ABM34298.1 YD repeat protein [Paracidovorax citrulli AAC00-1]PVY63740.1 RHS repeat-associated protein [Paracidovorax citrulli]REG67295.1 RHS repeat-associated protein [Paracidovorax citrulli]RLJ91855.1 RHS repeat-associated protein [Paracidovorax citrulli]WIY30478.1 RHS repeat-associated core domain-containing protein [Paracidovorax citrulli]
MSGKPAARQGDLTKKGGPIVQGSATVLIGSAGGVACSVCPGGMAVGNPVNPALGAKVLTGGDELDFALPGPLPLAWQRVYSSYVNAEHGAACGLLGYGWKLPLELRLVLQDERAVLFDASGRAITFEEPLQPGQALHSSSEDLWLLRGGGMAGSTAPSSTPAELLPWAQQPRWSHVPAVLRTDPGCVIAVPGAGGAGAPAWVFLPTGVSGDRVLHAVIDRFGRSQRYQWGTEGEQQGRVAGITDGSGRRYALRYERIAPDATAARKPGKPDEGGQARHPLLGPDDGVRLVGVDCTFNPLDPAVIPGAAPRPQPLVGYRYDSAGNLAEVLGADGTVLRRFGYDALHRMTEHQVRQGPRHRYVYEDQTAQGRRQGLAARPGARVAEQHNEEGLSYFFEYSQAPAQPAPSTHTTQATQGPEDDQDGPTPATASLPSNRQSSTLVRDSLGRTTAYHFEGEGGLKRLVRLVAPDGAEQGFRYDSAGRRLSATDALGRTTWWRYDGAGRLLGVQGPDGRSTQQHWGAAGSAQDGLLLASQDAAGLRTDFRYDDWGRLLEVAMAPAGSGDGATNTQVLTTRFEYEQPRQDAATGTTAGTTVFPPHSLAWCDQPVAMIDAQGGRSLYAYNACGQLARHTDCSGRSQSWRHGAWGEVVEATDALGQRTQLHHVLEHGALRLVGAQHPGNTGVRYRWGPDGLLAAATHGTHDVLEGTGEPEGTSTTVAYRHDLWGRVVEQVQAGRGVQLRYDVAGRLQELVNENGDVTRFVHDAADRLVQEVGFDGRSQVYGYDAAGQLTHTGDGHGEGHHPGAAARPELGAVVRTRLHYDLGGRLVARVAVRLPAAALAGVGVSAAGDAPDNPTAEPHAVLQIQRFGHTAAGALLQARTWEAELPHGIEPMALPTALSPDSSRPGAATGRPIPLAERWLALDTQALLSLLDRPGDPVHAPLAAALQAQRLHPEARVALARDAFGRMCGETQTLYRQATQPQASHAGGEPPVEFEHAITHTLGPLGQRTATQAQGLGTLQWLAYGSGHVHGLLLDGQPLVDWERDALHREVERTLHLLEGQGNDDLPAIVHARQLDPMGRMLHQDWRGLRHAAAMPAAGDTGGTDTGPSSAAGRIAPALGPLSTLAQRRYWYDPLGQLVGVQTPGEATRYGYDAWQRLSGLHRAGQGAPEVRQHWALDPAGNRLPAPPEAGVAALHADRQAWAREVRDHLQDPDFDLLRAGGAPGEGAGPVTHWPGNRIGWSTPERDGDGHGTPIRYRYDAFGNRVQALHADGRAQRLRYDALHHLREVWQREGTGGAWQRVACYRYDPFGRRLAKTVVGDSRHSHGAAPGSAATTHAGWDGDRLVHIEGPQGLQHTLYEPDSFVPLLRLERDQAIPTPVQAMFALENQGGESHAAALFAGLPRAQREWLAQALTDALGPQGDAPRSRLQAGLPEATGALLSAGLRAVRQQRQDATQAHATRIRHVLCDHLGTPIALVDANGPQAGLVTWAATYHAWGAVREEYDPHGIGQDIRFQGQQFDDETGLHYNRFRYYDPMLGQYVTQDPIGLAGDINKLIYPTNPTSSNDPLGLKEEGGWLSKIFGWGEKASSVKDAVEAGALVSENKKLQKELDKLDEELLSCLSQSPTCQTGKIEQIEKRMSEIRKKILSNTGEVTKIMMETPGTSAGGPIHIPGMKP